MDDLISRQAAIEAITDDRIVNNLDSVYDSELHRYKRAMHRILAGLPSAERRGQWIRTGEDGYCSVCKCDMPMFRNDWEWEYTETPYCPNCGARMEANDDEE